MAESVGQLLAQGRAVWEQDFVQVDTPAAGANATAGATRALATRVVGAMCTFDPDANVADRYLSLDFIAGGRTFLRNGTHAAITAADAATGFVWARNRSSSQWAGTSNVFVPVLDYPLEAGTSIRFTVDNIQAGDALTVLSLWLERLLVLD